MTPSEMRFWSKVDQLGPSGCWLWTAYRNPEGYGQFGVSAGVTVMAHRFAYELVTGPIPPGMQLDHTCHTTSSCAGGRECSHRPCVNPDHLELVTPRENVMRGGGWAPRLAAVTHCPRGHEFDEANTYTWRGQRDCRACNREHDAERRSRRRAA